MVRPGPDERLSALIDLGLRLGSELDPRRLLRDFCHAAREIIGARYAMVGIVDSDGNQLKYLFTSGMDAEATVALGSPNPRQGALKVVISENRAVRLRNVSNDPQALGFASSHPPVSSWLGAPIASLTDVYGYLSLVDKIDGDELNDEDERLAGILAAQVGRIYQNGTMYSEIQRHAAELEREIVDRHRTEQRQGVVLAVSQALAESGSLREGVHRALSAICTRLGWDMGAVWVVDRTGPLLRCLEIWQAQPHRFPESEAVSRKLEFAPGQGLPGKVWVEAGPAWVSDVSRELSYHRAPSAAKEGLRAAFAFPLMSGDQVSGVAELFSARFRETDQDSLNVFTGVTGPLARFIERKLAEESVRERDQLLRIAFDAAAEAMFCVDVHGECVACNSAALRALSVGGAEELMGRDMHDVLHGPSCTIDQCTLRRVCREGFAVQKEHETFLRADDGSISVRYWARPMQRGNERIGGVVSFVEWDLYR